MSNRSLAYYGPSYLRLARTFRNAIAIARAHHVGGDCDHATLWNGVTIHNPQNRSGLAETIVEIWGLQVYGADNFYTPQAHHVVLDVGANVGLFSAWLAFHAPGIHVLAFEPFAENVEVLRKNVVPWPSVHVHPFAIGGQHGSARMKPVGNRSIDHQLEAGSGGDVAVITLAEAINLAGPEQSIDLLKMDIEGSEYDVFARPQPRELMRRTHRIAIEWHEHIRPGVLAMLKESLAPTHDIVAIKADTPQYGMLYARRRPDQPV